MNDWSKEAKEVKKGRYLHYKQKEYTVLFVARHSETGEELVVYRAEYGPKDIWVRPLQMFIEDVVVDGRVQKRFTPIDV